MVVGELTLLPCAHVHAHASVAGGLETVGGVVCQATTDVLPVPIMARVAGELVLGVLIGPLLLLQSISSNEDTPIEVHRPISSSLMSGTPLKMLADLPAGKPWVPVLPGLDC